MKITKTIIIDKPINDVWKIIAHDFDQAYLWMGPVPHSHDIGKGNRDNGAPMEGRVCHLSDNPEGPRAREIITQYNEKEKSLTFEVTPVNVPAIVPLKKNVVQMSAIEIGKNRTEVIWVSRPQLKVFAYLFYPLLRVALPVAFGQLLKGLKDFAEDSLAMRNNAVL